MKTTIEVRIPLGAPVPDQRKPEPERTEKSSSFVAEAELLVFRRSVRDAGGTIVMSAPVPGGYWQTVRWS